MIPSQLKIKNEHTTLVWKLNSISLLHLFPLFSLFCSFIMVYPGVNIFFAYHCWDLVSLLNMKIGGFYWFCKILIYLWILSPANNLLSVEQFSLCSTSMLLDLFYILHLCLLFNLYDPLSSSLLVSTIFRSFHVMYQTPVPPINFTLNTKLIS